MVQIVCVWDKHSLLLDTVIKSELINLAIEYNLTDKLANNIKYSMAENRSIITITPVMNNKKILTRMKAFAYDAQNYLIKYVDNVDINVV
jgi:hypothetical protein